MKAGLPIAASKGKEPSASARKLGYFAATEATKSENVAEAEPIRYFLADPAQLNHLIQDQKCEECDQRSLVLKLGEASEGFCEAVNLYCQTCEKVVSHVFSSTRVQDDSSQRPPFHVNKKLVEAFGQGHSGMEKLSMTANISVMSRPTFGKHLHAVAEDSGKFMDEVLARARDIVKKTYRLLNPDLEDTDVIDITVSYDGTWQKRGFTSNYGLGFIIDVLTGLVIDYVLLSKACTTCTKAQGEFGKQTQTFQGWYEKHKPNCEKNYSGSSPGMERTAAEILWRRSVATTGMRYAVMIGDGDAKTVKWINEKKIYDIPVVKLECINHIEKNLGAAIRKVVADSTKAESLRRAEVKRTETTTQKGKRGKGKSSEKEAVESLSLGGGKDGNLTDAKILKLQSFYRNSIADNIPHVNQMKRAVMAPLEHYSSTDENPRHQLCPQGVESWCWYNREIALAEGDDSEQEIEVSSHKNHPQLINAKVIEAIRPVYERLSTVDLLARCVHGGTTNANEALHHCIWNKCPKHVAQGKKRLEVAVAFGVSEFNMGCEASVRLRNDIVGETISDVAVSVSSRRDSDRIRQSDESSKSGASGARRKARKEKQDDEKERAKREGTTYAAGLAGLEDDDEQEKDSTPFKKPTTVKKSKKKGKVILK